MPLPEPSEQEGESVKAGQEPCPESPEPGTDVGPEAPTKPKFSKLILLVASDSGDGEDCVMSLEMSDPDALAGTPQILPAEKQGEAVQPSPQAPEQNHSKPDPGQFRACCPCPAPAVALCAQTWALGTPFPAG